MRPNLFGQSGTARSSCTRTASTCAVAARLCLRPRPLSAVLRRRPRMPRWHHRAFDPSGTQYVRRPRGAQDRFDAMASHDIITFVGIIQTAPGMEQFPLPTCLLNCHITHSCGRTTITSLASLRPRSTASSSSSAHRGHPTPLRENFAGCGKMILPGLAHPLRRSGHHGCGEGAVASWLRSVARTPTTLSIPVSLPFTTGVPASVCTTCFAIIRAVFAALSTEFVPPVSRA